MKAKQLIGRKKIRRKTRREYLLVALAVSLLEVIAGFWLWYLNPSDLISYPADGFSRVANAYYVVFCDPASLANIGGVWNPLPSILEVPVVWFAQFWKPLASYALAGVIVSSWFAGGAAALLLHALRDFAGLSRRWAYLLTGLYAFNPFIFYYGMNGMSETFSYFFVILTVYLLLRWMRDGTAFYISAMGFSLMGLFMVRYEAIPFAIGVWLALCAYIARSEREATYVLGGKWEKLHYMEATSIILVLPLVFAIIVWVLFNAIILGDPLYFLHSAYSNSTQAQFAGQYASPAELVFDIAPKILAFIPLLVFILAARATSGRLLKVETVMLLCLALSFLVFHLVLLSLGGSYGWLRFYSYALPIAMAWLAWELRDAGPRGRLWRVGSAVALGVTLVTSTMGLLAYDKPSYRNMESLQQVATVIEENVRPDTLLVDSFTTWGVLLQLDSMDQVITSCSPTFDACVEDPVRMEVGYVLVPDDSGANTSDTLLTKWPELGQGKEISGFELVRAFYGTQTFYLYRVTR